MTSPEATRLERRYRRVLRLLPGWYRHDREEEMVGTFLAERTDDLELEYAWPGWRETAAVAALAVRTRVPGDTGPAAVLLRANVVRLVALLGLLCFTAESAAGWAAIGLYRLLGAALPAEVNGSGPAWMAVQLMWALPALAFVALLLGRRALALVAAAVASAGLIVLRIVRAFQVDGPPFGLVDAHFWLLVVVPVLCLLVGFHREAPPVRAKPWFVGLAVAFTAVFALMLGQLVMVQPLALYGASLVFGVAAVGYLLVPRLVAAASIPWLYALAVVSGLTAASTLVAVVLFYPIAVHGWFDGAVLLFWLMAAQVALAVVATVLATRAARRSPRTAPELAAAAPAG